ncbi:hypothetical protein C454_11171 [Haloferax gibbonsii ATCC 33959]|uniref:Uncharacterized protein n=1 Tax=Haloferax gibbonsii (strain ATCC 33959 / DSM 4427 / JCM 8863 / NBRC 102184 / NCIMB 2188 / Ma 2.38) TaxID=1227459 RepID=M0H8P2_HALGM|nr:hypothetical protein [Haloferax gibbonsii]ELZ80168.1 hypothetical protein C454_11171 [Haloferax gibbonsii ATCC 33959]
MTENPFVDSEEAEENIQEFIEQHGTEGLFVLYFRQFLFRFIMQELKSDDDEVSDIGTQLHLSTNGDQLLKNQREAMLERCEYWARDLVEYLKSDDVVSEVIESGDLQRLEDEDVEERVEEAIDDKFGEWETQLEEFLEELE